MIIMFFILLFLMKKLSLEAKSQRLKVAVSLRRKRVSNIFLDRFLLLALLVNVL